jgi:hypothetical protein
VTGDSDAADFPAHFGDAKKNRQNTLQNENRKAKVEKREFANWLAVEQRKTSQNSTQRKRQIVLAR